MLHLVSSVVVAIGVAASAIDSAELRREELMTELRKGGYTVILRHARTDRSFQEQTMTVPKERADQRNLNDDGFRDAALMGAAFRKHGIAFAEIISSPMFRCTETAELAAGKPTEITMDLRVFPVTPAQAALVKKAPKPHTNRLLVTHHFVLETHVPGIKPGDIAESEAAVVRHNPDGSIELIGRITLDDWSALVNPGAPTPRAVTATPGAHTPPAGAPSAAAHAAAGYGAPAGILHATIPDTHAGHLARLYITAFNSGSADTMRAFLESTMITDPARPTDERLKSYATLFEQHGPLSVTKVESSNQLEIVLGMKTKQGDLRLTVKSSDAQPMKVASVTFATMVPGGHR